MKSLIFNNLLLIYFFIGFSTINFSYTVSLSTGLLNTSSNDRTFTAVISNTKQKPAILEFKMLEVLPTQNNINSYKLESNEFKIFPEKVIVMPNQEKLITIHFKGSDISQERLFYFKTVPYAPQEDDDSSSPLNIKFLTSYEKIITLTKKNLKSNLIISAKKIINDTSQILSITLKNDGKTLYRSKNLNLKVKTSDGTFKIHNKELNNSNFTIFPNKPITVEIPWPDNINKEAKIKSIKY